MTLFTDYILYVSHIAEYLLLPLSLVVLIISTFVVIITISKIFIVFLLLNSLQSRHRSRILHIVHIEVRIGLGAASRAAESTAAEDRLGPSSRGSHLHATDLAFKCLVRKLLHLCSSRPVL